MALVLLLGLTPGAAVAETPEGPGEFEPPLEEPPFEAPVDGFDWSVPDRFVQKPDLRYEWRYDEATGTYDPAHVQPASWPVDLYGCRTEEDADRPAATTNTYTFLTADGQRFSGQRCAVQVRFPQEASYEVRMEVTAPDGSLVGRWDGFVEVKDLLIVTLGDSYASGEGNPEFQRADGEVYGDWVDDRCHRSSYAGAAQAAGAIERASRKTSVTFLSFACSGGTINRNYFDWNPPASLFNLPWDPYEPGDPNRSVGSGILGPYRGAQPPDPTVWTDKIPSQMDQLRSALGVGGTTGGPLRKVDALLMSAGGNDAGFGLLATACATQDDCVNPDVKYTDVDDTSKVTLAQRVQHDLALMPARYDALAQALDATGLDITGTYITEYPDPGTEYRSDTGKVEECEEILEDAAWQLGMEVEGRQHGADRPWGTELGFARNSFLTPLNAIISDRAAAHGWHYVGGISDGFHGHGYCVGPNDSEDPNRYIQTAAMSEKYQGPGSRSDTKGTMHPNRAGQAVYRDRILDVIRPDLAAAATDSGLTVRFDRTPPTTTASVSPATGEAGWHTGPAVVRVTATTGGVHPVSHVEHQLDGGSWQRTAGAEALVPVSGDGVHQVAYRAVDTFGNVSAVRAVQVRIDGSAPASPVLTLTGPAGSGGWYTGPVTVTATATDVGPSGVARYESRAGGGAWQALPADALTVTAEGVHDLEVRAFDAAGNAGPATAVSPRIDTTAPAVTCAAPDGQWHPADVTVACAAEDVTSGLADPDDASVLLSTAVAAGVETADAVTGSREICDTAGHCTTAGPVGGNRVDRRAPSVAVSSPLEQSYLLGATVPVDYTCTDGGSGVATCAGPVADGGALDTTEVGAHTFTVTGTDAVGNTARQSVAYEVRYDFSGFLSPVVAPPAVNAVRGGQVTSLRFGLGGDQGLDVLAGAPRSTRVDCTTAVPLEDEGPAIVTAGGAGLVFDATTATYGLQWKTDRVWNDTCRRFDLPLDDGTVHSALFRFGR